MHRHKVVHRNSEQIPVNAEVLSLVGEEKEQGDKNKKGDVKPKDLAGEIVVLLLPEQHQDEQHRSNEVTSQLVFDNKGGEEVHEEHNGVTSVARACMVDHQHKVVVDPTGDVEVLIVVIEGVNLLLAGANQQEVELDLMFPMSLREINVDGPLHLQVGYFPV